MNESPDEYHGVGGAYVVDPTTGKRLPEAVFLERQKSNVAPAATPAPAPAPSPTKITKE